MKGWALPALCGVLQMLCVADAGPAFETFKTLGNFTVRTNLCADAARVARGDVWTQKLTELNQ